MLWQDADRVTRVMELVMAAPLGGGRLLMAILAMFVATRAEAVLAERQKRARMYLKRARAERRRGRPEAASILTEMADDLTAGS